MTDATTQSYDFMPHGHCFYWQQDILILHVASDLLIALAYFSIPFALLYLAKKRDDIKFRKIFLLFAGFILACGITHVLNTWNFWYADYWLSGFAKAITALISVTTAVVLWKLMPVALSWPSPILLQETNDHLNQEISLRQEKEAQLEEAFDHSPIGKALIALNGDWLDVNTSLCNILGYTKEELLHMPFQQVMMDDDIESDRENVKKLLRGTIKSYQAEKKYKHKCGHFVWAVLSVTAVRNTNNRVTYFIAQIIDITYRKLTESEMRRNQIELEMRVEARTQELNSLNNELVEKNVLLEELAITDPLTKLKNRRTLTAKTDELIYEAKRYGYEFCLMIIDIDNFKHINDTHGHLLGDDIICAVSDLLVSHLRKTDVAARFGGDEFCVLLPHTSLHRAPEIANVFRERVCNERFKTENDDYFTVTCSIGIAEFDDTIDNSKDIMAKADEALYKAKEDGRNRVTYIESHKTK